MIAELVLIDTGPIVAVLMPEDTQHLSCVDVVRQIAPPLYTSWAVVTEAAWLLRRKPGGLAALMRILNDDTIRCLDLDSDAPQKIAEIAEEYSDLSPQLADLTLVYLASQLGTRTIFTLDRRDFTVYRDRTGASFELYPANR